MGIIAFDQKSIAYVKLSICPVKLFLDVAEELKSFLDMKR